VVPDTQGGGEASHLNLIEVVLPEYVYVAASPFKTGRHALAELLANEDRPPDDWVIRGGQFMSFRDPRGGPLEQIIDAGSVDPIGSDEIAFPDDEADERNMIELLRRTLGAQLDGLLTFNREQKAFYFPAHPELIEHTYHYVSLKRRPSENANYWRSFCANERASRLSNGRSRAGRKRFGFFTRATRKASRIM
jgi:hypothetical protein